MSLVMHGRYGNLSSIEAAKLSLLDIEKSLSADEWDYIKTERWDPMPEGYENLRLFYMIMGLQQVIIKNGGNLGFSKIPQKWFPK